MPNSQWVDIAIGVVMVWFLFALAVSAINEGVVKLLALRSKQLWSALGQMLDGVPGPQGIIDSLATLPTRSRPASPMPAADAPVSAQFYATNTIQSLEIRSKPTQKTRIENIPASVFSHALIELAQGAGNLSAAGAAPAAGGNVGQVDTAINDIESYINGLPPGALKSQLLAILAGVGHDVSQFRDGVERWFDGQMIRLSRLYRAQVHVILVLIGVVVAVVSFGFGLQSNSLRLVSDLQHDQNLRTILAGAASTTARGDLAKAGGCDAAAVAATPVDCQLRGVSSLDSLDLALRGDTPPPSASFGERLGFLLPWRHIDALLGVLVTAIAISFGSSFWFALLKRLVGLRGGAGVPNS